MNLFGIEIHFSSIINRNCYYEKGCGNRLGQCQLYDPKDCPNYTPKKTKRKSLWKRLLLKR